MKTGQRGMKSSMKRARGRRDVVNACDCYATAKRLAPSDFPLLCSGAPLLYLSTRSHAFTHFWTPAYPYHNGGPVSHHFGRRRTLILYYKATDPSPCAYPLLDADAPLPVPIHCSLPDYSSRLHLTIPVPTLRNVRYQKNTVGNQYH
ncbi:hypothetical protein Y032_0009g708 [Ancylostoma ceylanicum]|uniref:Uncharacterized protein n=1 Tax=Ancylostoma ceylanicum TaxID=53326 RepID=A0A016VKV5_9BILA|nr:hypothetical protein Y032_0009g708 [Ancylostoma ceylanicum]